MTPQEKTVLNHLLARRSITPVEAAAVHKIRHLPRRIADLKARGYQIQTQREVDITGQPYAHYVLLQDEPVERQPVQDLPTPAPVERLPVEPVHHSTVDETETTNTVSIIFLPTLQLVGLLQDDDIVEFTKVQLANAIATLKRMETYFA